MITTQKELRRIFWESYPDLERRKIKDYSGTGKMYATDTRCAWVDFVDAMHRNGQIKQELADRATL
jgi:hypothetical protein